MADSNPCDNATKGPDNTDMPDQENIKMLDLNITKQENERGPPEVTAIPREDWSKIKRPDQMIRYNGKLNIVLITHTGTKSCRTRKECVRALRHLQRHHIAIGYSDIIYNFMLGGDGRAYEGRGWVNKPGVIPKYPDSYPPCLMIAHIGYYGDNSKGFVTDKMVKLQYDLIENGMWGDIVNWNASMVSDYKELNVKK